jgi:thymidylate synthase
MVVKEQADSAEEAVKVAIKRLNHDNNYPLDDFDYIGYDDVDEIHVISYSVDEY